MFVAVGTIIIDDIVTSDGRTVRGVLGGAATHAAAGMRLWTPRVGLVGGVGHDFPAEQWAALERLGFDLRGVRRFPQTTPRAWQIYDAREHRTEIFQSPRDELSTFLPTAGQIAAYPAAHGFHLMSGELDAVASLCASMRAATGTLILWEPAPWQMVPGERERVLELIASADVFSPNAEESAALLGSQSPERVVAHFLEAGALLVSLRLGREGSLVQSRGDPNPVHVPPISLGPPVDVTGAGNAYCGGLLVGYHRTRMAYTAGLHGAIAAAVTIHHLGVPIISEHLEAEAQRLLAAHRAQG